MTKKLFKFISPLLCFIIIMSISCSAAAGSATAFSFESDGLDYTAVSLEPRVSNGALPTASLSAEQLRSLKLYPGGVPFGVKFLTEGILVVGFCDIDGVAKRENPSYAAGLREGDRITSVDGRTPISSADLNEMVAGCGGKALTLTYTRGGASYTCTLQPRFSIAENCYKSGIYVKDNGAGIGTVTYIVPDTLSFGGLGHGICEGESGRLVPISRGSVMDVTINGVIKGRSGTPGEVKGYFNSAKTGSLLKNTDCGVFGVFGTLPRGLPSEPLSLGLRDELREGEAYIWCTLDEQGPQKYSVEISSIDRTQRDGKCFTVKVTDPKLLSITGGIVQGMSGSPIIQGGKLVGAVTHVLINDPTSGYGIFIENMLARG